MPSASTLCVPNETHQCSLWSHPSFNMAFYLLHVFFTSHASSFVLLCSVLACLQAWLDNEAQLARLTRATSGLSDVFVAVCNAYDQVRSFELDGRSPSCPEDCGLEEDLHQVLLVLGTLSWRVDVLFVVSQFEEPAHESSMRRVQHFEDFCCPLGRSSVQSLRFGLTNV